MQQKEEQECLERCRVFIQRLGLDRGDGGEASTRGEGERQEGPTARGGKVNMALWRGREEQGKLPSPPTPPRPPLKVEILSRMRFRTRGF